MSDASAGAVRGVRHAMRGFRLIVKPGVRVFVVLPLLINTVLFMLALSGLGAALDFAVDRYLANWPEWIQWLAWVVFGLLAALIVFFTFALLANVVASPFNGVLAEAVERHLNGHIQTVPFEWNKFIATALRSIAAELRKLRYFVLRAIPLVIISFIPVVNAAAPPLWIVFGAWMLSLEYLDCPLGNHGRVFPSAVDVMRSERRLALGFGGCMAVLTLIPLINFVAMPVGVAGATSMYCEHFAAGDAA